MMQMNPADLDHYYVFGDVYETLDTCRKLEQLLGRLHRQDMLTEQDWTRSKRTIAEICMNLEGLLSIAS